MRHSLRIGLPLLLGLLLTQVGAAQADVSIYDIQLGVYPQDTYLEIDGVVVTGVAVYGFFVQELNPHPTYQWRYSGIFVYTISRPTCRRGDLVNVRGKYWEYPQPTGRSEIDFSRPGGGTYSVVGQAPIPAPVPVTILEVNGTGLLQEEYEGVLVRVDRDDNTLYADDRDAYGNEWCLKRQIPSSDSLTVMQFPVGPQGDFEYTIPAAGTLLTFAQGIMDYRYSKRALLPRSCDEDLGMACVPKLRGAYATASTGVAVQFGVPVDEASAENPENYELGSGANIHSATKDPTNPRRVFLVTDDLGNGNSERVTANWILSEQGVPMAGFETAYFRTGITPIRQIQYVANPAVRDSSALTGEIVTIRARVTGLVGSNYYFLQDDDGREWDNLYSRILANTQYRVGDEVKLAGRVTEYNYMTQLAYANGVDYQIPLGTTAPVTTQVVTADQIPYRGAARAAEPFESSAVRLESATLDSLLGVVGPYYDEWLLLSADLQDTAKVDFDELNGNKAYAACRGDIVNVIGPLGYEFGQYRIWPLSGRGISIEVIYDNPACDPTSVDEIVAGFRPALASAPNPLAERAVIRFSLQRDEIVDLEIFDSGGRKVRTLWREAPLRAGDQQVSWDGRNDAGQTVGAGAYYLHLRTRTGEAAEKVVIVR